MEWNTIRCCSHRSARAAPLLLHRYVVIKFQWHLHLTILPALDVPIDIADTLVPLDQLGISVNSGFAMDTAAYTVLSALTIIVTGLVAAHLLLVRRRHIKIMGKYSMVSNAE